MPLTSEFLTNAARVRELKVKEAVENIVLYARKTVVHNEIAGRVQIHSEAPYAKERPALKRLEEAVKRYIDEVSKL